MAKKDPSYTSKRKNLRTELNAHVRADLGEECLGDGRVETARLVRHSLVHNGGRATQEILSRADRPDVIDGEIQIMPGDVQKLFNLLRAKVDLLVQVVIVLPQFQV